MKKPWMKKLKSCSGESISEVLVASLVVSLAFVMVLSLIMASQKIINKTDAMIKDYYTQRNLFEAREVDSSTGVITISNPAGQGSRMTGDINVTVQSKDINDENYVSYEKAGS